MFEHFNRRAAVRVVTAGCVMGCAVMASAQAIELRPKVEKGSSVYKEIATETDQIVTQPVASKTTIKEITGVVETVESADKDGAKVSLTFDRLAQRMIYPGGEVAYDSDRPDSKERPAPIGQIYRLLVATPLRADLDASGRTKGVKGLAEFLAQTKDSAPDPQRFEQYTHDMSDDVYRYMLLDSVRVLYPEKPVKPGDTWDANVSKKHPSMGEVDCAYKIKLDKVEDRGGRRVALLSYSREMKLVPGTAPEPTMMGTRTTFETGRANGTAVIDVASGQMIEMSDAETASIHAVVAAPGAKNSTTEATAELVTRTKVRVIPVDERRKEKGGASKPPATAPPAATSKPTK